MNSDTSIKKNHINVLMLGPDLEKFTGGITTHIKNAKTAFASNEQINIENFVTTLGLYNQENWIKKLVRNILLFPKLLTMIRKNDIIHVNSTFDTRSSIRDGITVLISRMILGKKVILQYHGGRPSNILIWKWNILKEIYEVLLKKCKKILILSKSQGEEFKKCYAKLSFEKITNYVDVEHGANISETRYNRKRQAKPKALFIGRLDETKGLKQILSAVKILRYNGAKLKLMIAGDGPLRNYLNTFIMTNNLKDMIEYCGVVDGPTKTKLYLESSVLLLPTSHAEGLPFCVLEAFCYSIPVIGTLSGGLNDILVPYKNCFVINKVDIAEIAKNIKEAISDLDRLEYMGAYGYNQILQYNTLKQMKEYFTGLYTDAFSN